MDINNKIRNLLDQLANELEDNIDTIDRSIDPNKVKLYLSQIQDPIFKNLVRKIIEQTQYINFATFIREMRNIAKQIDLDKLSIYIDINDSYHSEFWCLTIIWPIIKNRVAKVFVDINEITNEYPILLVDDCIYSGHRMAELIRTINNTIIGQVTICICVPYATSFIHTLIPGQIRGDYRFAQYQVNTDINKLSLVYFYGNIIKPFNYTNPLNNKIPLNTKQETIEPWQYLDQYFDTSPCCLHIYFDHKIADTRSSYPDLYQNVIKALPNRAPIMAMEKLKIN